MVSPKVLKGIIHSAIFAFLLAKQTPLVFFEEETAFPKSAWNEILGRLFMLALFPMFSLFASKRESFRQPKFKGRSYRQRYGWPE